MRQASVRSTKLVVGRYDCKHKSVPAALTVRSEPTASSGHWAGAKQRSESRRKAKTERKWTKEQIKAIRRDTPAFAILEGVDPNSEEPPPYVNVRARMLYHS